jgi:hypothetical protein
MASVIYGGLSRSSNTRRRPITSSIVVLFRSTNISMETAVWFRLLGTTCNSFLTVSDVVAKGAKIGGESSDADPEVSDGLPFLEGEVGEVPVELLRARITCALIADPERPDRVPGLLHGVLRGEGAPEFGWNRTQEARHRLSVVVVLVFVGIVGDAVMDGVPDAEGLKVHLHDQGPFRIVGTRAEFSPSLWHHSRLRRSRRLVMAPARRRSSRCVRHHVAVVASIATALIPTDRIPASTRGR